jgi:hypothetical protein
MQLFEGLKRWKKKKKTDNFKVELNKMCYNNVKFIELTQNLVHCQYSISVVLKLLVLLSQFHGHPALHVHVSVALSACLTVSSLELRC